MKFTEDQLPVLKSTEDRPVKTVSIDALKGVGQPFGASSIDVGNVIKFPALDDMLIRSQPLRAGQNPVYYIAVEKNGRPANFTLGTLRRVDIENKAHDKLTQMLLETCDDDYDRLKFLAGKTIKCVGMATAQGPKFDKGVRVEGETRPLRLPLLEIVNEAETAAESGE